MNFTPEEILRIKTKGTIDIIPDSPLHKAVISAMKYYAKQEQSKKKLIVENNDSLCKCTWPSCQYKANCRNNLKA